MKYLVEKPLCDFEFWGGACDTADLLNAEQFERVEEVLEEIASEGWTETEINDMFWFESERIKEWAGYKTYYRLKADSGRIAYVSASNERGRKRVEDSVWDFIYDEVLEEDVDDTAEDAEDFDFEAFACTKYFKVTNKAGTELVILCEYDGDDEDLKDAFQECKIEELYSKDGERLDFDCDWQIAFGCDQEAINDFINE